MTKDVALSHKRKLRLSGGKSVLLLGMSPHTFVKMFVSISCNVFISLPPAGNISMDIKLLTGLDHTCS